MQPNEIYQTGVFFCQTVRAPTVFADYKAAFAEIFCATPLPTHIFAPEKNKRQVWKVSIAYCKGSHPSRLARCLRYA